jgi:hypothetical protein
MYAALFNYMGKRGAPRRRVGGRLDGPCSNLGHHGVSCTRTVVSSRVGSRRSCRDVSRRARGSCWHRPVRDAVAGMAAPHSRTLHSAGAVATAPGVGLYTRGQPPRR